MPHQTFFKSDLITRVDEAIEKDKADDARWRAVCQIVDARDKRECRACGKKSNPDAVGLLRGHRHHIVYRSAGGQDVSENLATLCAACHNAEHVKRTLKVDGDADDKLTFWKPDGRGGWYVWRQEIAVGVWERD